MDDILKKVKKIEGMGILAKIETENPRTAYEQLKLSGAAFTTENLILLHMEAQTQLLAELLTHLKKESL